MFPVPGLLNDIEQAFADGASAGYNRKMIEDCKSELDNVLNNISVMTLPKEEHAVTSGELNRDKASELIDEIKPLLEKYMSLNDEQIETVKQILSPVGEQCGTLVSQLDDFDL